MWSWGDMVEDKIKRAQDEGAFDDLPGKGKPLRLDHDSSEDWMGNHLLREAGLLPDWLQLRKEIHDERPAVVEALHAYRENRQPAARSDPDKRKMTKALEEHYLRLARSINRKIDEHNRRCPSISHELPRFTDDPEALLRLIYRS